MFQLLGNICLLLAVHKSNAVETGESGIQIKLDSGTLQGSLKPRDSGGFYYNFQGIPYAMPPVGDLRFKEPVPFKKWSGILNATSPGPSCVEIALRQLNYLVVGQEDCLYLNVYSPQNPHTITELLPVMFWIYGGSFREGASHYYHPEHFMNKKVVIVSFNYRLGVFGFLSTEDNSAPGNYGMKDMLLALKWVKKNIVHFGGDSSKVTIFGESAGAAAVGYLMLHKEAKGLFKGAIMQSGSPLCSWALHRNPRKVAFDLGVALGITTNSSFTLINYLRGFDLPNEKQTMINVNFLNFVESINNGGPFGPVFEPRSKTAFLTKDSYRAYRFGDFHQIPVLMGVNSQESKLFNSLLPLVRPIFLLRDISPSSLVRDAMNVKSAGSKNIIGTKIKNFYFKYGSFVTATDAEIAEYFSDDLFVRPIIKTAQLLSKHVPVYFYVYDFNGSVGRNWIKYIAEENRNVKGVSHATELWYMWNSTWGQIDFATEAERLNSRRLIELWTNFATFENPTPKLEPMFNNIQWPSVKGSDMEYFYIGTNIKVKRNFKESHLRFWSGLYANYSNTPLGTF